MVVDVVFVFLDYIGDQEQVDDVLDVDQCDQWLVDQDGCGQLVYILYCQYYEVVDLVVQIYLVQVEFLKKDCQQIGDQW